MKHKEDQFETNGGVVYLQTINRQYIVCNCYSNIDASLVSWLLNQAQIPDERVISAIKQFKR